MPEFIEDAFCIPALDCAPALGLLLNAVPALGDGVPNALLGPGVPKALLGLAEPALKAPLGLDDGVPKAPVVF